MTTCCRVFIPTDACIRGSKFKDVTLPGSASDIESLSSKISSRFIKETRFLLRYKAKKIKGSEDPVSIRLQPNIRISRNICTLETLLSNNDAGPSQWFLGLRALDSVDKAARVYKICRQVLGALKNLYKILATLRKRDPDIPCAHGLLIPSSIYRYPNGEIKLSFYGLRKDQQSDSIYCDLLDLLSIYTEMCNMLLLEPDPSFKDTVEQLQSSDKAHQLEEMLAFVEARLTELSGSYSVAGHLLPLSNIEGSVKDGASELALPDNIEVDELERSSTVGISATSRSLRSSSEPATILCPPDEAATVLLDGGVLIPEKCIDQIHQHYCYPAGQAKPEGLYSTEEGCTMTILLNASHDIQMVCPYLTYFSILSSKHPIQELKKSIADGNVLHIFTMDNVFEMLRDLSQSTPLIYETLTRQETVLQIFEIAFNGTSHSKEYREMDSNKRALLHENMPRLIKFMIQDVNFHPHVMVTDPHLKEKAIESEVWSLIDKGIACYLSLIAGRGWPRDGNTNTNATNSSRLTDIANSCIACLKSYLHVAVTSYAETFTNQIDKNEAYMSIILKCTKLSIFEITFVMYFHNKGCSHVLANNMVAALVKKDDSQAFTCSIAECSYMCGLLIAYLTSKGTNYLSSALMGELLFGVVSCLETSMADASSGEYQKVPSMTKVLINYYVLYLSQCALELIKEAKGIEENVKRCFACLNVFINKLHGALTSSSSTVARGDSGRYCLLVYIATDCLARFFRCIGGIERLVVRCLENIYTGDEYAQIYRPICAREEPLFLSYSDLPSTAAQGIGGPAIWQTENCRQHRKKILLIYHGVLTMLTPQLAELLSSISKYPALSNSSIIHFRITVVQNVIVEALYIVMQSESKTVSPQYMKSITALGLGGRLEAILNSHTQNALSLRVGVNGVNKEEGSSPYKSLNNTSTVCEVYTYSMLRKIVDLHLSIHETQAFYIRHLMCRNEISRDDFVFDVSNVNNWNKDVYLKTAESLRDNKGFVMFLKVFDTSPNTILSTLKVDTFYRDIPVECSKIDEDMPDFCDMPA